MSEREGKMTIQKLTKSVRLGDRLGSGTSATLSLLTLNQSSEINHNIKQSTYAVLALVHAQEQVEVRGIHGASSSNHEPGRNELCQRAMMTGVCKHNP